MPKVRRTLLPGESSHAPHDEAASESLDRAVAATAVAPVSAEPASDSKAAPCDTLPPFLLRRIERGQMFVPPSGNRTSIYLTTKRALDIAGATALLMLFAPIMLITLIVLTVTTRGRPFFRQTRLGRCGRPFTMWKFRTMIRGANERQHLVDNEAEGPVFKNRNDPRITRMGRILRVTSIDELPQLFNVLAGHMALVGPRPPVALEVAQYKLWQIRRLGVKPGLTCLWQVSGRSEVGFDDWVRMDLWYVDHQSLTTDLQLLVATPWSVLSCRGAF